MILKPKLKGPKKIYFKRALNDMLRVKKCKYTLKFKFDAGTSRGVLKEKKSFFLQFFDESNEAIKGLGEVSTLFGLSPEHGNIDVLVDDFVKYFNAKNFKSLEEVKVDNKYTVISSLNFGIETGLADLSWGGTSKISKNSFYEENKPIKINGLVWMGEKDFMLQQISEKLNKGFSTIKLKVGAINLEDELYCLETIRKEFNDSTVEIRLDANGAFENEKALKILERFSIFDIHSIEQPIAPGQWQEMAALVEKSPIPVVLDEELINVSDKSKLLHTIKPHFIILKPSLMGGLNNTKNWISKAQENNIKWWITSALESNVGLNAICQLCSEFENNLPQGLGTGGLYINNIDSPLELNGEFIRLNSMKSWDFSPLIFEA
jgi:o-succinylbenzoate synthase